MSFNVEVTEESTSQSPEKATRLSAEPLQNPFEGFSLEVVRITGACLAVVQEYLRDQGSTQNSSNTSFSLPVYHDMLNDYLREREPPVTGRSNDSTRV
jgi:hypothetical protein